MPVLCCCLQTFSSCGKWGYSLVEVCRPLIVVASLIAEYRLWRAGSLVVEQGLTCPRHLESSQTRD